MFFEHDFTFLKNNYVYKFFCPCLHTNRWSFLEIVDLRTPNDLNQNASDEMIATLAGQMEANLTSHLILMHWKNTRADYCAKPSDYCTKLENFIENNQKFVDSILDTTLMSTRKFVNINFELKSFSVSIIQMLLSFRSL